MALSDLNNLSNLGATTGLKSLNSLSNLGTTGSVSGLGTSRTASKKQQQVQSVLEESGKASELKLPDTGEKPNKFLSGGVIMDTFDWLNMLSYGTVGVLKGEGFKQGIDKRSSFSDEDALGQYGWAGAAAGLALDIATDPLTYIAPATVLAKFGKATKLTPKLKKAQDAFVKTKVGKTLGESLIYRFGQDPVYKEMAERTIKNVGTQTENVVKIAKPLTKMNKEARELFTTTNKAGQTIRRPLEEVQKLADAGKISEESLNSYKELGKIIDNNTKEMVKLGLLPEDVYKNLNKYVNNQFLGHELKKGRLITPKSVGIDSNILKPRKDISDEVREQLEQILDAGYLLPETAIKMTRTIENAKFMDNVAQRFSSEEALEGFLKMPDSKRYGALAGKHVPEFIQKDLVDIIDGSKKMTGFEKATKPIVGAFKFGKVILNPATHARNMMSNFVLNSFEGMNPLDPRAMKAYGKAIKEIKTNGKLFKEAKELGLGLDTFASAEIKDLIKTSGKVPQKVKNAANKIADIYEKEEQWAKMAQYIFQKEVKGLSPEDAWKVAERATFNYAQVTPVVRRLRQSILGYPFLTFTYKVTPQVARTALKKPTRISNIGKAKEAAEEQADLSTREQVRDTQPQWVKDGFYLQLPGTDKEGRTMMLDLTYLLPFGDLVSGQFFVRGINSETGFKESPVKSLAEKTPFINTIIELSTNQDFYGNKIYKESDDSVKQSADIARHLFKFMAPPLVGEQLPGGYRPDGSQQPSATTKVIEKAQGISGEGKQTRTITEEALRQVGIKINPVDLQTQQYWSDQMKTKAIQTFLEEEGEGRGFEIFYKTD